MTTEPFQSRPSGGGDILARSAPLRAAATHVRTLSPEETLTFMRGAMLLVQRSFLRIWGRDCMLYTGGVSFFALLAVFPALTILVSLFSLLAPTSQVEGFGAALVNLMPVQAQDLVQAELGRLAGAPRTAISVQSIVALSIGLYAAHRGFKALLAGLSFIYEEDRPRNFVQFNLMALVVAVGAFALLAASSSIFLAVRVLGSTLKLELLGQSWLNNEWTWESVGLVAGFTLLYRYAMASHHVRWRASVTGGVVATGLSILASWFCAFYVGKIANYGATYGSIGAVVVFLVWLSWNVNAVFFGGAVATEMELILTPGVHHGPRRPPKRPSAP
ncbi:YihY/virulence factor BrkB family protein [Caulobacter sp. S45]|uniref:YihY/virulence factor BrkB family protein n=1 Tax=Caulobacter sp. S45 TaxID=1641861 RepID=UPI0020C6BE7B|nr:YihY/virulence factor BrkB family protein [Caulobacter sp. S45]